MINLFQAASDDQSLGYLRFIFGSMNGVIYKPQVQVALGESTVSLLGAMFRTFNSVVLTVGVLIVIYVTVVGVMLTAHEGEFMGKRWSNLWIPIRTVLGIVALVPLASGYCAIQIVMMWVIVQGIGAADRVWSTALSYVDVVGSPYSKITLPSSEVTSSLTALFNGIVCDVTMSKNFLQNRTPNPTYDYNYFCYKNPQSCRGVNIPTRTQTSNQFELGPLGLCGKVTYCNYNQSCQQPPANATPDQQRQYQLQCVACRAQQDALFGGGGTSGEGVINVFYRIAERLANADYAYQQFYYNAGTQASNQGAGQAGPTGGPDLGFVSNYCADKGYSQCCTTQTGFKAGQQLAGNAQQPGPGTGSQCLPKESFPNPNKESGNVRKQSASREASNMYWNYVVKPNYGDGNFISTATNQYVNGITDAITTFITSRVNSPQNLQQDFAQASNIGWIFAGSYYYKLSEKSGNNLTSSIPTLAVTAANSTNSSGNVLTLYRNNYVTAGDVVAAMASETSSTFRDSPQLSPFAGPVDSTFNTISRTFQNSTEPSSGTSALSQVQTAGRALLITAQVLYPVLLAVSFLIGLLGCIDVFVLGNAVTNPLCGAFTLSYFILIPGMFALLGYMIILGGLLGIYVPLIPYIIFTFGAIGWLISTVETMVAGPLVALGVLSPSGQHELLGKAEPALLLLFNVFLRPTLMIFGLIASMFIANVVVTMINYAFWTTVYQGLGIGGGEGSKTGSPLALIIFLSAYVMLIVAALNKAFQTISIVPERVMSWIGGQGQQYGEGEALQEAKGAVQSATGGARGAGEALRGKGDAAVKARRKKEISGGGGGGKISPAGGAESEGGES